jgi:hypothetical protein
MEKYWNKYSPMQKKKRLQVPSEAQETELTVISAGQMCTVIFIYTTQTKEISGKSTRHSF